MATGKMKAKCVLCEPCLQTSSSLTCCATLAKSLNLSVPHHESQSVSLGLQSCWEN